MWSSEEDAVLLMAIAERRHPDGRPQWNKIARALPGRSPQESRCRFRRMRVAGRVPGVPATATDRQPKPTKPNKCLKCGAYPRRGHSCTAVVGFAGLDAGVVHLKLKGQTSSLPEEQESPPSPPPANKRQRSAARPLQAFTLHGKRPFSPICTEWGAPCSPAADEELPLPPALVPATRVLHLPRGRWSVPPTSPTIATAVFPRDLTMDDTAPPLMIDAQPSPIRLSFEDLEASVSCVAAIDEALWRLGTVEPWASVEAGWQTYQ